MKPGDELRDLAAQYFEIAYGKAVKERRACGKKVDIFVQIEDFGRTRRLYVEAKDYASPLTRLQVSHIYADYSGIVRQNAPATLIIITRIGITTDANSFIEEQPDLRHMTIAELENETIGLRPYIDYLANEYHKYIGHTHYVHPHFYKETSADTVLDFDVSNRIAAMPEIESWVSNEADSTPLAILGGYGVGKTSLADQIAIEQAKKHLINQADRIPILVKLGQFAYASKLSGVLAELFQVQHRIDTYSYARFREFQERGRFLIILDGFDEMKHAMSWNDFNYIVSELAKMNRENSKILLLGRPSAFTSDLEARYVLRGLKRLHQQFVKMPHWPTFRTYEIASFDRAQRAEFIENYVSGRRAVPDSAGSSVEAERITFAKAVADKSETIFSRPVHLKMLVDLASGSQIANEDILNIESHWTLYEYFIAELLAREAEKEARQPISEADRRQFLMQLAMWLWRERDAQTHFPIDAVPVGIMPERFQDIDEVDARKRELLTIPLIDRKAGDHCYFVHRSFAEFLVALSFREEPSPRGICQVYPPLLTDGIISFVEEILSSERAQEIINELLDFRGYLSDHFLELLYDAFDDGLPEDLIPSSPWSWAFRLIDYSRERSDAAEFLLSAVKDADARALALVGDAVFQGNFNVELRSSNETFLKIGCAILIRLFQSVRWTDDAKASVGIVDGEEASWNKRLAVACFSNPQAPSNRIPYVQFFPERLAQFLRREAHGFGIYTSASDVATPSDQASDKSFLIDYDTLFQAMGREVSPVREFFRRERSFKTITEVASRRQRTA